MAVGDILVDLIQELLFHISSKVRQVHLQDMHQPVQVYKHLRMDYVLVIHIINNIQHHQDQIQLILQVKK